MSQKEAQARIKINKLLADAGWRFLDDEKGKANIQLESGVSLTKKTLDALGNNFESQSRGYVDYLLLDNDGFPIIVVEAKRESIHPLEAKEQARDYAQSMHCRFVILSNGNAHYFWDTDGGNPQIITEFPTLESLQHRATFKPNREALANEVVDDGYLARIKDPHYAEDPRYQNTSTRGDYLRDEGLVILRPFQVDAIHALQRFARTGSERFLFEMATGTGKTMTTAAVAQLFLRTGNAKRVLFLVDRIELEDQAEKALSTVLGRDWIVRKYKEHRDGWKAAQVVVSTVQTLISGDRYRTLFSPTDFELVISDEAHRSLGGNSRAVFEYFNGYKLGLTATPKDYLKNFEDHNDIRAFERRELLDTYRTFGCASGTPTFRYSLLDGVRDGYLINPKVFDARTEITTKLLSEEGYAVRTINEDGNEAEEVFTHRDFEHKFFNTETNIAFCKAFLEHAQHDPISNEIGKSLIFCVSQRHAAKITQILNEMAHQAFPGKYDSDFAVQITSHVRGAQDKTVQFTNNALCGRSRFVDGYKTSRARVAVTVGMMTTGYDCPDILNLCMMRPIFSPSDFVQMKGRGTRKNTFSFNSHSVQKSIFYLFDFFGNYEYFEEKFNYDEVLQLPQLTHGTEGPEGSMVPNVGPIDIKKPDEVTTHTTIDVGTDGMRIDRELYFQKFEKRVTENIEARRIYEEQGIDGVRDFVMREILNKPTEFFTADKLRQALTTDRWVSFTEILRKAFGEIEKIPTLEEKTAAEFDKFQDIEELDADLVPAAQWMFATYLQDEDFRKVVDSKQYAHLYAMPGVDMHAFDQLAAMPHNGMTYVQYIPTYINDYVGNLKEFERV